MSGYSSTEGGFASRVDHLGRPAWIALTVLGFIAFWPLGLALLFFGLWSGRMGCGYARHGGWGRGAWDEDRRSRWERKMARYQEKMSAAQDALSRWSGGPGHGFGPRGFAPTGNRAFDEYRESMLQRLEDEAKEFQDFLTRLRAARDKAEFDQYMADRQNRGDASPQGPVEPPQQPSPPVN